MTGHRGVWLWIALLPLGACGGTNPGGGASPTPSQGLGLGSAVKVNHFGWRPGDTKIAIWTQDPGPEVRVVRSPGGAVALRSAGLAAYGRDADSGDDCWLADFSSLVEPGAYWIESPALGVRSYEFEIDPSVYNAPGRAAMKSFYFQRCNAPKGAPWAGHWTDERPCHVGDGVCPRHPSDGTADFGVLDLRGGWHDAGDYQKNLSWNRGVEHILWGYERNGGAWTDDQLEIPESGNGVPDLLDEASWELDFYVRMQRPDGHFLSVVHQSDNGACNSPPSCSDEVRVYSDTRPDRATAWGVMTLAHAALLYETIGRPDSAARYSAAARRGWGWLSARTLSGTEAELKCAAAAALFRLDHAAASARGFVEGFTTWESASIDVANYDYLSFAVWHTLANPAADAAVKERMKASVASRIIEPILAVQDAYSGLRGGPGSVWDWHWGSTQNHASYGFQLMMALDFGITGGHTDRELRDRAQTYLHYLLGRNTMSMVYLTNMAEEGGEHSSFQTWHKWFSFDGGNEGSTRFLGKPESVLEPSYPYFIGDDRTSLYGPPPGLLVGGANWGYSGTYSPPAGTAAPARAYRDWAVPGCDWDGTRCRAAAWEITETSGSYTGAFVGLASFFMGP